MQVYKFGGASVKDAKSIRGLSKILKDIGITNELVIVVSAIGKTTNAMEGLLQKAMNKEDYSAELQTIRNFHFDIVDALFKNGKDEITAKLDQHFQLLEAAIQQNSGFEYGLAYDQVVSFGEIFSTTIISAFLNQEGLSNEWVDARKCVLTDSNWQNATVNWEFSGIFIKKHCEEVIKDKMVITQGFIGSDSDGNTTTLGREGSDFSAAIFGACLDAEKVTVWKDVEGVLNADPKKIKNPVKYKELPYEELIEMSYYGASVVHPKTLKPLANKNIELIIRSFQEPETEGTRVANVQIGDTPPAIIIKEDQCLISFSKKDLSFMEENNISYLTSALWDGKFKLNLIQKSALQLSVVCNFNQENFDALNKSLDDDFMMLYNTGLKLVTIKNYDSLEIPEEVECKEVLLEQQSRKNIQFLVK